MADNPIASAEATWQPGGRDPLKVKVLSRPDALNRVEVEFLWSGQRQRVHKDTLVEPNQAAASLINLGESFVVSPTRMVQAKQVVTAPSTPRPPPPLPGTRIDYDNARALFPTNVMQRVPRDCRLRLLGKADGSVVLRAYDPGRTLLGEIAYEFADLPAPQVTAPPRLPVVANKPTAVVAQKTVVKKPATPPIEPKCGIGKNALKGMVHPDLGVLMRNLYVGRKTADIFGGFHEARYAIYVGKRDREPVPLPFAFAIGATTDAGQKVRLLIVVHQRNGYRDLYAMTDPEELLTEGSTGSDWDADITRITNRDK